MFLPRIYSNGEGSWHWYVSTQYFYEHLHTFDGDLMPMFRFSCWNSNVSPFSLISKQIVTCSFIVMSACMYKISSWFGLKFFQRSCNDQDQLRALKVQRANSSVDPCRVIKILKSWGIHTCKAHKHLGGVEVAHTVQTKEFWQAWTVFTPLFWINWLISSYYYKKWIICVYMQCRIMPAALNSWSGTVNFFAFVYEHVPLPFL